MFLTENNNILFISMKAFNEQKEREEKQFRKNGKSAVGKLLNTYRFNVKP